MMRITGDSSDSIIEYRLIGAPLRGAACGEGPFLPGRSCASPWRRPGRSSSLCCGRCTWTPPAGPAGSLADKEEGPVRLTEPSAGRTLRLLVALLGRKAVLVDEGEVLVDEPGRHPGEQGQLLAGVLGGQQPDPFEAADVVVHRLLGVVGARRDVRRGEPGDVQADDGCLVGRVAAHVDDVA